MKASAAATPLLLEYLDSDEFRTNISDIPQLSGASSETILEVLRALITGATFHHNFPLASARADDNVGLDLMISNGFVPNIYTAIIEGDEWIAFFLRVTLRSN